MLLDVQRAPACASFRKRKLARQMQSPPAAEGRPCQCQAYVLWKEDLTDQPPILAHCQRLVEPEASWSRRWAQPRRSCAAARSGSRQRCRASVSRTSRSRWQSGNVRRWRGVVLAKLWHPCAALPGFGRPKTKKVVRPATQADPAPTCTAIELQCGSRVKERAYRSTDAEPPGPTARARESAGDMENAPPCRWDTPDVSRPWYRCRLVTGAGKAPPGRAVSLL